MGNVLKLSSVWKKFQLLILAMFTRGLSAVGAASSITMHQCSADDLLAIISTCDNPQILRIPKFMAPGETL